MPFPEWAYDVQNFDPPPDDELICSICQSVFCDPVRVPCLHVFCCSCIEKWLEQNNNCPICREDVFLLQEVVPIVKNMIMKLTMSCHNSKKGCKVKFKLESCNSHLKECLYEPTSCRNWPCDMKIAKNDLLYHELNTCSYRYVSCLTCKIVTQNQAHDYIESLPKSLRDIYLHKRINCLTEEADKSAEISYEESRWKFAENFRRDYFLCKKLEKMGNATKEADKNLSFEEKRWQFTEDFIKIVEEYEFPELSGEQLLDFLAVDLSNSRHSQLKPAVQESSQPKQFRLLPSRLQHVTFLSNPSSTRVPSNISFTGFPFNLQSRRLGSQYNPLVLSLITPTDQQTMTMDTGPD